MFQRKRLRNRKIRLLIGLIEEINGDGRKSRNGVDVGVLVLYKGRDVNGIKLKLIS